MQSSVNRPAARPRAVLAAVVAIAALATACTVPATSAAGVETPSDSAHERRDPVLDRLVVADEDPNVAYDSHIRDTDWGHGWQARGHGCNTRELVLLEQAVGPVDRTPDCHVTCASAGPCWKSPYDGVTTQDPADLQIDHLVPVAEAAHSPVVGPDGKLAGPAQTAWTRDQKHHFYEDLDNLNAVTAATNSAKGDGDPAEWQPPLHGAQLCTYAVTYTNIKVKWHLTVDRAEHDALDTMLANCP